ncbi:MAG: DUF2147 domain-containing protein [Alphaproteobacteria bacterium]|nr:DUF2147 domain-containing protein [Alphaproteobacteria bacterium]
MQELYQIIDKVNKRFYFGWWGVEFFIWSKNKMKYVYFLIVFLFTSLVSAAEDITGLWTTIDDETGEEKSVVQIYEYEGKVFGRVVKLFKNVDKTAVGIKGNPKILGLDIIWNLEDKGERFKKGKILDPAKGKIYSSEAWIENGNLILRGKIGPFGRNQTWIKNNDLSLMIKDIKPSIPEKE